MRASRKRDSERPRLSEEQTISLAKDLSGIYDKIHFGFNGKRSKVRVWPLRGPEISLADILKKHVTIVRQLGRVVDIQQEFPAHLSGIYDSKDILEQLRLRIVEKISDTLVINEEV